MPENWKTYKLGEVAELRKQTVRPKDFNGEKYIGLEHIGQGDFLLNGIGIANDVTSNKFKFKSGDILYGKIRPYFKKVYQPKFSGICSTDILIIKSASEEIVTQGFLYQLIKTQSFTDKAVETSSGTKMPRADWNSLEKVKIILPPLEEQKSIAAILSALDDKIELNLQMNKTLEEMAMALYKHWFVDFGPFQNEKFIASELGKIPEGWEVKKIEETSFQIGDGNYSSKYPTSKEFIETGIPFIRAVNMVNGSLINNDLRFISSEKHNTITKGHLKEGDVLIVTRGSIGEVARVPNYFIGANINAQLVRINGQEEVPSSYLYQTLKEPKNNNRIVANKSGTALQQLPVGALKSIPLVIPPKKLLHSFEERTGVMYVMIDKNNEENQTLTKLRDTLLPKLISGEVRVKQAEKFIIEAL